MNSTNRRTLYRILLLGFLLGCHQGRVALWIDGNIAPIQIFPCAVTALPHTDQQHLTEGIHVTDKLELAQLMEDYLS